MREDAATESDLVVGGYRDRVLTELAQNASDAAVRAGVDGAMAVWIDGNDLHVANVGAPLTRSGVESLSALRASDKSAGSSSAVGRFGVGFTAVRAIGDEIEFRSRTGSITFGATATRGQILTIGASEPAEGVPVLRLPWPSDLVPETGWDSEIVVALRSGVSATALLDGFASEVTELLLELPGLSSITLQGNKTRRSVSPGQPAFPDTLTIGSRSWWQCITESSRWFLPLSGDSPVPHGRDVLHAPTRSDEALSLPAMVVTTVDMAPDRRRILPGASLEHVTTGYADMVRSLPITARAAMIPTPALPLGEVDAVLRENIVADLVAGAWVPTVGGDDRVPGEVSALPGASASLCDILADVCPGLAPAEFVDAATLSALSSVGIEVLGLSEVVDRLSGLDREPSWWRSLYAELDVMVCDSVDLEEVAALPVPLTDGRTVTGPRTVVAMAADSVTAEISVGNISWARVVHPDAMHPLLNRCGIQQARAADLLADPALTELLSGDDTIADALIDDVLTLVAATGDSRPIEGLGSLPLRDTDGDYRPADELLLATSPLQSVLASDSPFSVVAADVVERWGAAALRAVGVGWTFGVVLAELPTGPDHDLDDEDEWWDSLTEDPESFVAVRDLDLVDDDRWPQALTILLSDPVTAAAMVDRGGYTAWWLRRHASVAGQSLGTLRSPDDRSWDGVLDTLEHEHSSRLAPVLAGAVVDDASLARLLLRRLADDRRVVPAGASIRVHGLLADAVDAEMMDITEIDPPTGIRCVDGTVCAPGDALVVDRPWLAAVVAPNRLVLSGSGNADALADLLDVRVASAAVAGEVVSGGVTTTVWSDPMLAVVATLSGLPALSGAAAMHDELRVRLSGAVTGERVVPFWVDGHGALHVGRQWIGSEQQ